MAWRECENCGGFMDQARDVCARCGEDRNAPRLGHPRFSVAAREAPQEMGGLLELYPATGQVVRFVGWCTGGVIALSASGALVWTADLSYVGTVRVDGAALNIDRISFDIDTGKIREAPLLTARDEPISARPWWKVWKS